MTAVRPPRWTRMLLRITPYARRHPEVAGDLDELYALRAARDGRRAAARQYRRDVASLWTHRPLLGSDRAVQRHTLTWGAAMDRCVLDLRYAFRRLRAAPATSGIAILTIALAVGANTAVFSITDSVLLRPAPFPDPGRVVNAYEISTADPGRLTAVAFPTVTTLRARHDLVSALATWHSGTAIVTEREPEQAAVALVSPDYFAVFGVRPLLGRAFDDGDMRKGAPPVAIVSHAFWQKYFGGDAAAIGRPLRLADGTPTIVGVLPPDFVWTTPLYRPLQPAGAAASPRARQFPVIARLQPGVTLDQARREFSGIARQQVLPGMSTDVAMVVEPYSERGARGARPTVRILTGAVALILLIGCVNVASLLFARGATRARELALQSSLGAGRSRLIAQLLAESCLLALAGGAVGAALASLSLDAIVRAVPLTLPATAVPRIDVRVLAFTFVVSLGTGVLFGLPPAWRLSRANLAVALASGNRAATPMSRRLTRGLIAVEIALTLVLVSGGALMLRSLIRLYGVDKGFDPAGVLTLESAPVRNDDEAFRRYYAALTDRVRSLPGVDAVGAADSFPLGPRRSVYAVSLAGSRVPPSDASIIVTEILPGFFDALRIPLRAGRVIDARDRAGLPAVAVINESAVRAFFTGSNPIGQRIGLGKDLREIVGVVADIRSDDLAAAPEPELYRAYLQGAPPTTLEGRAAGRKLALVVRSSGDTRALAAALREEAQRAGQAALVQRVRTFDDWIFESARLTQQRTTLFVLLGTLGLLLAIIGVFGMTAYGVAQRTREIGVRVALGASRRDVLRTVGGGAASAIALGILGGAAAAVWASRAISAFLYEVRPWDPVSLAAAAATLSATAAVAAYLPARRALDVDPVVALRVD